MVPPSHKTAVGNQTDEVSARLEQVRTGPGGRPKSFLDSCEGKRRQGRIGSPSLAINDEGVMHLRLATVATMRWRVRDPSEITTVAVHQTRARRTRPRPPSSPTSVAGQDSRAYDRHRATTCRGNPTRAC